MGVSRGELKIEDILRNNGLTFQREYIFDDLVTSSGRPLRFDFAVFDDEGEIDFLIEFQGEQHYTKVTRFGGGSALKVQKFNDKTKKEYCLRRGLPLVVVPFWDYEILNYDYLVNRAEELRM